MVIITNNESIDNAFLLEGEIIFHDLDEIKKKYKEKKISKITIGNSNNF